MTGSETMMIWPSLPTCTYPPTFVPHIPSITPASILRTLGTVFETLGSSAVFWCWPQWTRFLSCFTTTGWLLSLLLDSVWGGRGSTCFVWDRGARGSCSPTPQLQGQETSRRKWIEASRTQGCIKAELGFGYWTVTSLSMRPTLRRHYSKRFTYINTFYSRTTLDTSTVTHCAHFIDKEIEA